MGPLVGVLNIISIFLPEQPSEGEK